MNFKKKFLIVFSLCFLPSLVFAGTAHYVNCSAGSNGNGSYASPWNNISSVNSHSFSTGDDVYFKVNTTCTPSTYLAVDWSGTTSDRVVIGAYSGYGQYDLNGNSRPIIDGNNNTVPSPYSYQGLISIQNAYVSYVTVENLKLQNSGRYGVGVARSDNINVDNCYIYRPNSNCIVYSGGNGDGVDTGIISENICENSGYPDYTGGGAAIEISAGNYEGATTNITVRHNRVSSSKLEGIGLYKKVTNSIVEYNTVYDIKTVHIYVAAAKSNIIRHNLVYMLDDDIRLFPSMGRGHGILIDIEEWQAYCFSGNNEVYGNLIAGLLVGIGLSCEEKNDNPDCVCHEKTKIYNNTLVDNQTNIRNWTPDSRDSIEIKNNSSFSITYDSRHAINYSPAGVTWSHNWFDEAVTGNAANNAVIGDAALKKSSGWRSLTANSLDGTEFSFLSGSEAINAGISIPSYNDRITAANYKAYPIKVTKSNDSTPDIGAWMTSNAQANNLDPPTDLVITAD